MKHLYRISSIIALTTVLSGGAWAAAPNGVATGDWVNKYFVDFDDFTQQSGTTNPTNVVVAVNKSTGGDKIDVTSVPIATVIPTYTGDGSTISINASNQISSLVTDTNTTYQAATNAPVTVVQPTSPGTVGTIDVKYDGTTIKKNSTNQLYVDVSAVAQGDGNDNTEYTCSQGYIRWGTTPTGGCLLVLTDQTAQAPATPTAPTIMVNGVATNLAENATVNNLNP